MGHKYANGVDQTRYIVTLNNDGHLQLLIKYVQLEDAGMYLCQEEYTASNSKNFQLTVIGQWHQLYIYNCIFTDVYERYDLY